jgi:hypothetical protein
VTLQDWQRALLGWDMLAAIGAARGGRATPPPADADAREVPDSFDGLAHYVRVWAPFVLRETRARVVKELETAGAAGEAFWVDAKCASRGYHIGE